MTELPSSESTQMMFEKRLPLWVTASTTMLILVALAVLVRNYNDTGFSWLSALPTLLALIHLPQLVIDQFYIPRVGRLIVDQDGIRLQAGRLSWGYRWQVLECVYVEEGLFGQRSLKLNSGNEIEKIVSEMNYWKASSGELLSVADAIEGFLPVKPVSEMPNSLHPAGRDLGPIVTKVVIVIGVFFLICAVGGVMVRSYYPLGGGTPTSLWVAGGLLAALAALYYLYNNYVDKSAYAVVCLLSFSVGAFFVPIVLKSAVLLSNDVEVHSFELIEKNGGYQHWRSLNDNQIEFDLGSVNNTIHTENEQGAILELELVNGSFMTLLLPGELEKTRYRVE